MKQLLLILIMAVSGWSVQHEIYFNSEFTGTSTGAIDAPYKNHLRQTQWEMEKERQ